MNRNIMLLLGFAGIGVLSLLLFVQMLGAGSASSASGFSPSARPTIQEVAVPLNLGEEQAAAPAEQVVSVRALGTGLYDKQEVRVKAGQPVRFQFSADSNSGCGKQLVIQEYGVNLISRNGETVEASFTPQKGTYAYRCGMNMFRGRLYAE
ncbi:MAG: cupredoxin domain-containing protein [Candidatus Micrarchaeota archaeon]